MPLDSSGNSQQYIFVPGTAVASGGTGSAPSAATDGVDVTGCTGFRAIVSADSGQTLSGAGTMRFWMYSKTLGRWCYNPDLDWTPAFSSGTWRDVVTSDLVPALGYSRVYAQLVGFTASSGNATPALEVGVLK